MFGTVKKGRLERCFCSSCFEDLFFVQERQVRSNRKKRYYVMGCDRCKKIYVISKDSVEEIDVETIDRVSGTRLSENSSTSLVGCSLSVIERYTLPMYLDIEMRDGSPINEVSFKEFIDGGDISNEKIKIVWSHNRRKLDDVLRVSFDAEDMSKYFNSRRPGIVLILKGGEILVTK
jgi:hypothetical protein